jgi:hypothetical protein
MEQQDSKVLKIVTIKEELTYYKQNNKNCSGQASTGGMNPKSYCSKYYSYTNSRGHSSSPLENYKYSQQSLAQNNNP